MLIEKTPAGVYVPYKEKPPEPERGPLEFENEHERERVQEALQVLWNVTRDRHIKFPGYEKHKARRAVVALAIKLFLGDVEFPELT